MAWGSVATAPGRALSTSETPMQSTYPLKGRRELVGCRGRVGGMEVAETVPLHLANAARTLERILNREDPQHVHIVEIRPRQRNDAASGAGATAGKPKVGTVAEHPNAVGNGHARARPDRADGNGGKQAA